MIFGLLEYFPRVLLVQLSNIRQLYKAEETDRHIFTVKGMRFADTAIPPLVHFVIVNND